MSESIKWLWAQIRLRCHLVWNHKNTHRRDVLMICENSDRSKIIALMDSCSCGLVFYKSKNFNKTLRHAGFKERKND